MPLSRFLGYFLGLGTWGFGGPIATVGYMQRDLVQRRRWISRLITPGPVVITATFIGYLVAGLPGAIAIFTPIFAGVVIPGPWFLRHRDNPQITAFVTAATAAAAGATAGAVIGLSRQTITDWPGAAIAALALAILLTIKLKEPYLVGLAALVGLALYPHW